MKPTPDSHSNDCARAQDGFAAYLYGELEGPAREQVEAHLEHCADCAAQLSAHRETLGHLDDWKLPTQARPENPDAIAAGIRAQASRNPGDDARPRLEITHTAEVLPEAYPPPGYRRPSARHRMARLGTRLAAVAAALLVTFSIFGAEISTSGGQLHLRLAMPWAQPLGPEITTESQLPEQQVRRIAADEFNRQTADFERQLQQYHTNWTLETQTDRERLAFVVDRSNNEHRRAIVTLEDVIAQIRRQSEQAVNQLQLRQEQLDQRTRDALVDLTEAVLVLSE